MNLKYVFILFITLLGFQSFAAQLTCRDFFIQVAIHDLRRESLQESRVPINIINGIDYTILGQLSETTGPIYLAKSPEGRKVVIKQVTNKYSENWINSIYYEKAATEFYTEEGFRVPQIIDAEIRSDDAYGVIVKEYIEGASLTDLSLLGLDETAKLEIEKQKISLAHQKFKIWLKMKRLNLYRHPFGELPRLINQGDIKEDNFIYEPTLGRWVLIDP